MKKILAIVFLTSVMISCDQNDLDTILPDNDNYYVKYDISTSYPSIFRDWTVTTPQGSFTKEHFQTRYWEDTFGPVKKGFKCSVQVSGTPTISIYVSKNDEPFALKASVKGSSASYTIDF